jgi:hypothetical protein
MSETKTNFRPGDKVVFNMNSEKGPMGKGTVTRVDPNGKFFVSPIANIGAGVRFFNIRKDESK